MELSPEEKKRIYEEEKVRIEAQEKAKKEAKAKKTRQGCLGCLGLVVVIFILASVGGLFRSGQQDSKPSISDIQILEWHLEREYGRTRVIGELKNNSSVATGVQIQAIARDKQGRIIDSEEWWPASISNIPSGAIWPINKTISDKENIETVEVSVIDVNVWE